MVNSESTSDDLAAEAASVVQDVVIQLVDSKKDSEDLSWVPSDFGRQVLSIAWEHQFDIEKAAFRRKLHRYLDSVVDGAGQ